MNSSGFGIGDQMRDVLRALINQYLSAANAALASLITEFGERRLLFAWREGKIPEYGTMMTGQTFRFHGIGCRFTGCDSADIDVELTDDGTVAGFDAWRLYHFCRQFPENRETFESLAAELRALADAGELIHNLNDCPHLFMIPSLDGASVPSITVQ